RLAARGAVMRLRRSVRRGARRVVAGAGLRYAHAAGDVAVAPTGVATGQRERSGRDEQRDRRQPGDALDDGRVHANVAPSRSPNDSRTTPSKSAGSSPSAFANSRRYMSMNERSSSRRVSPPAYSRAIRSSSHTFHSRGVDTRGVIETTSGSGSAAGSGSGMGSGSGS